MVGPVGSGYQRAYKTSPRSRSTFFRRVILLSRVSGPADGTGSREKEAGHVSELNMAGLGRLSSPHHPTLLSYAYYTDFARSYDLVGQQTQRGRAKKNSFIEILAKADVWAVSTRLPLACLPLGYFGVQGTFAPSTCIQSFNSVKNISTSNEGVGGTFRLCKKLMKLMCSSAVNCYAILLVIFTVKFSYN
nr:PREDICTED: uncharacterized protein LOC105662305 [Megachile rotundata]